MPTADRRGFFIIHINLSIKMEKVVINGTPRTELGKKATRACARQETHHATFTVAKKL